MKICVVGTGYVGLVAGAAFASTGSKVTCVDIDENKINKLKDGIIPIYEPGLTPLVESGIKKKRLHFTTSLAEGVNQSDIIFIAVGTPQDTDGSADLSFVRKVCEGICKVAKKEIILGTKSTVPVGTGDQIEEIFKKNLNYPFTVFSNPEFLKEGDAVNDFLKPDRIILGINDDKLKPLLTELYAPFTHQQNRLIFMSRSSAEITKYAANSILALRISFMNEMARLCEIVGGNVNDVRVGIGSDHRIGPHFLYPGLGFGGSCFPKDVNALQRLAKNHGLELKTITALNAVNEEQPQLFFKKIAQAFGCEKNLSGKTFAVWGLSFKAKTDDTRYSPALKLIDLLLEKNVKIKAYDPQAMEHFKKQYGEKVLCFEEKMDCVKDADGLIIATEWNEFKSPDFEEIKKTLKVAQIFDGRNLYNADHVKSFGFRYTGVGFLS